MLGKGRGQHLGECKQRPGGGMGSIWARATFGERPRLRTQCLEGARGTPGSATFRGARSELASIQGRQCVSGRRDWRGAGHVRGAVKAAHGCAQRVIIRRSIRCLHQQKGPRWISIAAPLARIVESMGCEAHGLIAAEHLRPALFHAYALHAVDGLELGEQRHVFIEHVGVLQAEPADR